MTKIERQFPVRIARLQVLDGACCMLHRMHKPVGVGDAYAMRWVQTREFSVNTCHCFVHDDCECSLPACLRATLAGLHCLSRALTQARHPAHMQETQVADILEVEDTVLPSIY